MMGEEGRKRRAFTQTFTARFSKPSCLVQSWMSMI